LDFLTALLVDRHKRGRLRHHGGYTVDVGKLDSKEIDFIARKADEILYVQVAFEIPENTHETDNLLHIKDNYKKILITGKYYEQTEIDGIEVMYVVDWLLK
jgi:uncharacterized protein HI_1038